MGALLSFLGGSVFRMLWGEISAIWNKHQDHKHEIERLELQEKFDSSRHEREIAMITLQHQHGVEVVRVQGEIDLDKLAASTFDKGVEIANRSTGITWVDAWNSAIRAALATEVMILIFLHHYQLGWKLDDRGWELAGAVLGVFVADRFLFRRGK